jgi:hypothetical protein
MADEDPAPPPPAEPESSGLPSWVPILIGVVLVALAALAVWTGMRYRATPLERAGIGRPGTQDAGRGGAPGEPQAGASRVMPGEIPEAQPADPSRARVSVTGGPQGIQTTIRYTARRGAYFHVEPADALLFVNEQQIGPANQFASADQAYEFPEEGKFSIRVVAPGHADELLVIHTDPNARDEVVRITQKLQPAAR